jgi:hypothetical protein
MNPELVALPENVTGKASVWACKELRLHVLSGFAANRFGGY